MPPPPVLSVSGATAIIKDRLDDLPRMTVEGEVSNLHPPNASGHLYFTLGDENARLNVTFFSFRQREQGPLPPFTNGSKVRVTGKINLYPPHGSYQLNAERLELAGGVGDLLQRFEALKRKLFAEGLCDPARKRPLPRLPRRIGIVTAPTGAAIRDILNILGRRYPNLHIILAPARVQGNEAAPEIAAAIRLLNRAFGPDSPEPLDAMIVGRGGGSLEDLWPFNEEIVARAVAESKIPIISAVGHEPDIAITDFVADLRAPTPSAAAELICGCKEDFERALADAKERLIKALRVAYAAARAEVRRHESSALFRDPLHYIENRAQRLDVQDSRLTHALENTLANIKEWLTRRSLTLDRASTESTAKAQRRLADLSLRFERVGGERLPAIFNRLADRSIRLDHALAQALERGQAALAKRQAALDALNPYAVLRRGYAMATDANGHILTDPAQTHPGAAIRIILSRGPLHATVRKDPKAAHAPRHAPDEGTDSLFSED